MLFRDQDAVRLILLTFSLICVSHSCLASTVVAIVCPKGIAIASDSGATLEIGGNTFAGRRDDAIKFVAVQNHLVVASIGTSDFTGKSHWKVYDYHFGKWMTKLEQTLAPDATPGDLTDRIVTEAASTFAGLDEVIREGAPKHDDPQEKFNLFMEYVIFGYSKKQPQIYVVQLYIDWDSNRLLEPKKFLLHPNEKTAAGDYSFYAFGVKQVLDDVGNPASYAHRELTTKSRPFGRLIARQDISLEEISHIAQDEVLIEEHTNPTHVFGDIVSTTILPSGATGVIEQISPNNKPLPPKAKPATKK
jgi:hypothetical protein